MVDHVYITLNEYILEEMRNNITIYPRYTERGLLESMYQESAVPLSGSALHNQHINYYYHYIDDREKRPRDTTPVFTPSKLFVFRSMEEVVTLGQRTTEIEIPNSTDSGQLELNNFDNQKCAIWIEWPDESLTERLLSLCQTISTSQPVTDLHLNYGDKLELTERYDKCELTEANVPIMSKEIKSLVLKGVDMSSSVLNYLLQHESLQALRLLFTCLHDGPVPLIFNHRNLKVLSLERAHMSREMCEYVCHHLGDLVHLEHINLSFNDLSHVSSIRLSNTTSPVTLELWGTHMSPELLKIICRLTSGVKLKKLDLWENILTGNLHHLLSEPHQGLQSMEDLGLDETELKKNDIEALTCATQSHVLPGLKKLNLWYNQGGETKLTAGFCELNFCMHLYAESWEKYENIIYNNVFKE